MLGTAGLFILKVLAGVVLGGGVIFTVIYVIYKLIKMSLKIILALVFVAAMLIARVTGPTIVSTPEFKEWKKEAIVRIDSGRTTREIEKQKAITDSIYMDYLRTKEIEKATNKRT